MTIPRVPRPGPGALLAIAMIAGACGTTTQSGSIAARSTATATAGPATVASPLRPSASAVASGSAVAADSTLLEFVPVGGLKLTYDPDTTALVAADPTLAASASGLAIALAMPTAGSSPGPSAGADLGVVSVIRLRDPSFDETWFRDWRDSYDEAACANAAGVTRRAETDIHGNTVFVGSCAGGSYTYHVRIDGGAVVISLTSIGPSRIGQTIMEGLAP